MSTKELLCVTVYVTAFAWAMGFAAGLADGKRMTKPAKLVTIYDLPGVPFKGTLAE
jgi:hypothetical protein